MDQLEQELLQHALCCDLVLMVAPLMKYKKTMLGVDEVI